MAHRCDTFRFDAREGWFDSGAGWRQHHRNMHRWYRNLGCRRWAAYFLGYVYGTIIVLVRGSERGS